MKLFKFMRGNQHASFIDINLVSVIYVDKRSMGNEVASYELPVCDDFIPIKEAWENIWTNFKRAVNLR